MTLPSPTERREMMAKLFGEHDYLTAYRMFTDWFVARDPHAAIGSQWEELGALQIDYLVRQGMRPEHRLLDFGCGTLRAGRHFIRYLDAGNYTGVDLSQAALDYGAALVVSEGLADKQPVLIRNAEIATLDYARDAFDLVIAQSVFTHLFPEDIAACMRSVRSVMTADTRFFFTYNEAAEQMQTTPKDIKYPFAQIEALGAQAGLRVRPRDDYAHPRGQLMAEARRIG